MPDTDMFVLRVKKTIDSNTFKTSGNAIEEIKDVFENINVGQPIAKIGNDNIQVLLKQKGKEHSVSWKNREEMALEDIHKYLTDIKNLATVEQSG